MSRKFPRSANLVLKETVLIRNYQISSLTTRFCQAGPGKMQTFRRNFIPDCERYQRIVSCQAFDLRKIAKSLQKHERKYISQILNILFFLDNIFASRSSTYQWANLQAWVNLATPCNKLFNYNIKIIFSWKNEFFALIKHWFHFCETIFSNEENFKKSKFYAIFIVSLRLWLISPKKNFISM